MFTECKYCKTDRDSNPNNEGCMARNYDRGLFCTRDPDHDGPHVACGIGEDEHSLAVWGDGDE